MPKQITSQFTTAEVTFTELRSHAKTYFDQVESGGSVRVTRNGKAIAEIIPIKSDTPSWKRPATPLSVAGLSLSRELIHDRDESA